MPLSGAERQQRYMQSLREGGQLTCATMIFFIALGFGISYYYYTEESIDMPLNPIQYGEPAPNFEALAVIDGQFKDISLHDYAGKYVVILYYPPDTTSNWDFPCPTDIIDFSMRINDFRKIGCEVIALTELWPSMHMECIENLHDYGIFNSTKIPLISDYSHYIARDYGILNQETNIPFRGMFIIDDTQKLRHIFINNLPVGPSVNTTLRLVKELQLARSLQTNRER